MENQQTKEIQMTVDVQASPADMYRAFTSSSTLREWLCDAATTSPKPGGRFYVAWNEGYYAAGEYTQTDTNQQVGFTWLGRGEPGLTQVQVSFAPSGSGTQVTLVHGGFGTGEAWSRTRAEVERGWQKGLENLVSVFNSGPDQRITTRPMMGILFGDFSEEKARAMGLPVTQGVRIDSTVEGMAARHAGLDHDDVIVSLDGKPVRDYNDLAPILSARRAGETVKLEYYNGIEKKEAEMVLSARPLPETPASPAMLAAAVNQGYQEQLGQLEALLEGATESETDHKAGGTQWSVKEVLAHLIHSERGTLDFISQVVGGHEDYTDSYGDNQNEQVQATVRAYCTLPDMMEALKRSLLETVYYLEALPDSIVERKDVFWRLAFYLLSFPYHLRDHKAQIITALEAARK